MPEARALPQPPPPADPYEYVRLEDVPRRFFGGDRNGGVQSEQLAWVCKSKGRRKRRSPDRASALPAQPQQQQPTASPSHHHPQQEQSEDGKAGATAEHSSASTLSAAEIRSTQHSSSRLELFLRARVVVADADSIQPGVPAAAPTVGDPKVLSEDRVLVRYPKGSTYRVRRDHLLPVLERQARIVIAVDETPPYRRCCAVHTLPAESFLEIGCDLGHNLQRVHETGGEGRSASRLLVGVDKCPLSVRRAKEAYPHLTFVRWDPLEQPARDLCDSLGVEEFRPDVIAVDINGSRELPAVLACLTSIWDAHKWEPRLVVVKSRTLHARVRDDLL